MAQSPLIPPKDPAPPRRWVYELPALLRVELLRAVALLGAALLLGLVLNQVAWTLFLAAAGYGLWQQRNLIRLLRWIEQRKRHPRPDTPGLVYAIAQAVEQLRERHKERKRKLANYIARFEEAAAALPDAIVILSAEAEIEWANGAAAELLGVRWPEDAGQPILNLVRHPEMASLIKENGAGRSYEIHSPRNPAVYLNVRTVPYGQDKRLLVARDITRVRQLDQIRSDFVANVSHELRTPLTVISGYLEAMDEDQAQCPEPWRTSIKQMRQQSRRMQEIIEELLLLSQLERESEVRDAEVVDVVARLKGIKQEAEVLSGDGAHVIELDAEQGLRLYGSGKELYSAFSNLVFNAVQYTPRGGRIRIRWFADEAGAHLEVADTGVGIAAHHIPRLTERFYRVDVARSRQSGGTGLGLAIVKHVLNRHGAKLRIESVVGSGSTFTCDFPPQRLLREEEDPGEPVQTGGP